MCKPHEAVAGDLKILASRCILGPHPLDKEQIIKLVWRYKRDGMLDKCDILEIARANPNWKGPFLDFLTSAERVIDVLYPLVKRGDIKP